MHRRRPLVQRTSANGDFEPYTFDEVLSQTAARSGIATDAASRGQVAQPRTTVGNATGPLAGIHGQGTFVFTRPASVTDVINYVYTP